MTPWHDFFARIRNTRVPHSSKRALAIGGSVFNLLSLFLVIGLVAMLGFWFIEKPPMQPMTLQAPPLNVEQGGTVYLGKGLSFETDTNKAYYYMWLADDKGNSVYKFPSVVLTDPTALSFSGRVVDIPKNLPPGEYKLMVYVKYALNPLKTAEMSLEIARVQVFPVASNNRY